MIQLNRIEVLISHICNGCGKLFDPQENREYNYFYRGPKLTASFCASCLIRLRDRINEMVYKGEVE